MKAKIALLLFVFCSLAGSLFGQAGGNQGFPKKMVAIYVARGNGDQKWAPYVKLFATELQLAVSRSAMYNAVERTGRFLELLSREQSYQRTGQVDESKIAELGKQEKVDYVLSVDMADFEGNTLYVAWKLIDVETAIVQDGASELKKIVNIEADLKAFSEALTKRIVGGRMSTSGNSKRELQDGGTTQYSSGGSDYTEMVFGINMQMVYVEGGDFMIGCTSEQENECSQDEYPAIKVSLDGYYIGKFEITQSQWNSVMGTSVQQQMNKAGWIGVYGVGANYPMYYVSWEEATAFCEELSRRTGKRYRLPTEAEWEYAARGGNKQGNARYSDSFNVNVEAWYRDNSGNTTHPVGTKRANTLGIHDMRGNVSEWCGGWYSDSYSYMESNNPQGPSIGRYRVKRGGDWNHGTDFCRVAIRSYGNPDYRDSRIGFRVVCEL